MKKEKLTRRQKQILDYIIAEIQDKNYPPSVREIGQAIGLSSSSTVHSHLASLEKKGYIKRDPSKPRAIEVIARKFSDEPKYLDQNIRNIPLVGNIAAGGPILAEQNIEEYLPLPSSLLSSGDCFALTVKGDSMIEAGIFDGDYVIARVQQTADNGDIVVALINNGEPEATVKRFYRGKDHIRLNPDNPAYQPIILDEVSIQGKVVAVFRRLVN